MFPFWVEVVRPLTRRLPTSSRLKAVSLAATARMVAGAKAVKQLRLKTSLRSVAQPHLQCQTPCCSRWRRHWQLASLGPPCVRPSKQLSLWPAASFRQLWLHSLALDLPLSRVALLLLRQGLQQKKLLIQVARAQ